MSEVGLQHALEAMESRGLGEVARKVFEHYYRQVESGAQGLVPESTIAPLIDLPDLGDQRFDELTRRAALAQVAVVKLNGGLGTSMGMTGPKTALAVRGELTFLDVIAAQVLAQRARYDVDLPLLLMNSFRTREVSLGILDRYPSLPVRGLPLDFLQNAEPKLRADDLMPVSWPDDPELEWCPPGHGDVYVSLRETGLIAALRARGIRWAFISNADNLGATCDPDLAAWVMTNEVPYLAEVCERTPNDRKGGHLAVRKSDGRLVLRDSAMTPPEDDVHFQDVTRHTTFHANSLWVDLDVLDRLLDERDGVLGLPVIVNRKTVDPSRKDSTKVIQIETAMGAAIETIDGARAVRVPRERFRPVKTTNELLMIRSDLFTLSDDSTIVAARAAADPRVDLDPAYFALVPAFEKRFPAGPPSLLGATSFTVRGPVTFGAEVTVVGDVHVESADELVIAAGTTLTGDATGDATGDVAGEG